MFQQTTIHIDERTRVEYARYPGSGISCVSIEDAHCPPGSTNLTGMRHTLFLDEKGAVSFIDEMIDALQKARRDIIAAEVDDG